jgi:hypothetical protein
MGHGIARVVDDNVKRSSLALEERAALHIMLWEEHQKRVVVRAGLERPPRGGIDGPARLQEYLAL